MKFSTERLRYEDKEGSGLITLDFLLCFFKNHLERWFGSHGSVTKVNKNE